MENPIPIKKKRKTENYVNKEEMIEELRKYKRTGIISNRLGKMFIDIANKYLRSRACFRDYTELDDFVGDAILRMVSQIDKFDCDRKGANAFWYFTTIAHRRVIASVKSFQRANNFKKAMTDSLQTEVYDSSRHVKT